MLTNFAAGTGSVWMSTGQDALVEVVKMMKRINSPRCHLQPISVHSSLLPQMPSVLGSKVHEYPGAVPNLLRPRVRVARLRNIRLRVSRRDLRSRRRLVRQVPSQVRHFHQRPTTAQQIPTAKPIYLSFHRRPPCFLHHLPDYARYNGYWIYRFHPPNVSSSVFSEG